MAYDSGNRVSSHTTTTPSTRPRELRERPERARSKMDKKKKSPPNRNFNFGSIYGKSIFVVLKGDTERRLAQTCFRGRDVCKAGNFSRWRSFQELLNAVGKDLGADALEIIREMRGQEGHRSELCRLELDCGWPVGWTSTVPVGQVPQDELESFRPSKHSSALRVRETSTCQAPATDLVTFVYEVVRKTKGKAWLIIIHDLHPGPDTGELWGDITARENVAFLGWQHPGEPIPDATSGGREQKGR